MSDIIETYPDLFIPEPKGDTKMSEKQSGKYSRVERAKDAFYEGQEIASFRKGAGLDVDRPVEAQGGKEMSEMMLSLVTAFSTALAQMAGQISGKGESPTENKFLDYLLKRVEETQAKIANAPQQDPAEILNTVKGFYDMMTTWKKDAAKDLGIPEGVTAHGGAADTRVLIELEQMKGDREIKLLQIQEEMKEREQSGVSDDDTPFG